MVVSGKLWKEGNMWVIEIPLLSVVTQGTSKKDAYEMIVDALKSLINKRNCKIKVIEYGKSVFAIVAQDKILIPFILKRRRLISGLTQAQVTKRLGLKSVNSYAQYEQAAVTPTVAKMIVFLKAMEPKIDYALEAIEVHKAPIKIKAYKSQVQAQVA